MADGIGKSTPPSPRVLIFEYSELNPALRDNPHALLDPQRRERPVEHDAMFPAVFVTAYQLARDLLLDPSISRNFEDAAPNNPVIANVRRLNQAVEAEFGAHSSMLTLDDPDHGRVRGVVAQAFLQRAAAQRATVQRIIDEVLDGLEGRTHFDVVADYAAQIPIRVLGALLGCKPEDHDQLRAWTEAGQGAFDPTASGDQTDIAISGRRGILGYFQAMMAARESDRQDDLVSDLLNARDDGAPISDNEILHNLFALLVAGHLTTSDLIGNGVLLLLQHEDARQALAANPDLIAGAVDEILRYEPPISTTARFTKSDGAIGGCPFHKGDALTVSLIAANRDPDKFDEPHRFDITRAPNPHLAFGAGAHICVGAPLARVEGQMAILGLLQRFPTLARDEQGAPKWRAVPGVRGLAELKVRTS